MIEVRCHPSGDIAWAEDPESALVAARTLCDDDFAAWSMNSRVRSVSFYVEGQLVRGPVAESDVWAALAVGVSA